VRKVGGRLNFDPQPQEYSIIAVDETVVKCNGTPIYVWAAVDAETRQPIWFGVSLTRTTANALRFLQRLRRRCLGNPVILTDRGPWYRDSVVRAGFQNHVYQTFGLRSSVERFFGYLKDRTRAFYNNVNPKKTLFTPLVDFLRCSLRGTPSGGDKNWAYPDRSLFKTECLF